MFDFILSIILIVSILYYFYFSLFEGRDERGKSILYTTNSLSMGIVLISLGFFQLSYRIADVELSSYMNWNYLLMVTVFSINSLLILILKRN